MTKQKRQEAAQPGVKPDEIHFLVTVRRQKGRNLKHALNRVRRALGREIEADGYNVRVSGLVTGAGDTETPRVWWDE